MSVLIQTATFTRPADTTSYASGDLVANSVTAGSVVPLAFGDAAVGGVLRTVQSVRLRKSGTGANGNNWTLLLFNALPTSTAGDNDAFAVSDGRAKLAGKFTGTAGDAFTDGTTHLLESASPVIAAGVLYGLLQVGAAYAPASAETFTLEIVSTTYTGR